MKKQTLYDTKPELRKEWDWKINGDMKQYTKSSRKEVIWICSKNNHHKWLTKIRNRTRKNGSGCPICSNKVLCSIDHCNSLYYDCSKKLKKEWDEKENGSMKNYLARSKTIVSWVCSKNDHHKWNAEIYNRNKKNGSGCPICLNKLICPIDQCNSLYYNCSNKLKKEWDNDSNGSMKNYSPRSHDKVSWICCKNNHHKWKALIYSRNKKKKGNNCPICSNKLVCPTDQCNSLYYNCSNKLKKEWDEKENGSTKNYVSRSKSNVSWICSKNNHHKWKATIYNRNKKNGNNCPICLNKLVCPTDQCNSLYYNCSDKLKKEWSESNGSMKDYVPQSNSTVLWICSKNNHHKWKAAIHNRSDGNNCPICSNKLICPIDQCNSLCYNCPDKLKKEWDEKENGSMKDYLPRSSEKVSWICLNNKHIWKSHIGSRQRGHGCPKSKYKTERLLLKWLNKTYAQYTIISQSKFDWCKSKNKYYYRYDFLIKELKIFIELDGDQHFRQVANWKDPKTQQKTDKYKMKKAHTNGYSMIRILQADVYNNKYNWKNKLKKQIKLHNKPTIICNGNKYKCYYEFIGDLLNS